MKTIQAAYYRVHKNFSLHVLTVECHSARSHQIRQVSVFLLWWSGCGNPGPERLTGLGAGFRKSSIACDKPLDRIEGAPATYASTPPGDQTEKAGAS
ncbi:MAG: hypothetical protein ABJP66_00385 [Hyphomicrobiales bacterium]